MKTNTTEHLKKWLSANGPSYFFNGAILEIAGRNKARYGKLSSPVLSPIAVYPVCSTGRDSLAS
ncbi:MAG: hypothetical protein M0Q44_15210 [Methylobacter sp.]|jgi:hypothetical protein|nr:hypothetical protein [Methylobacter sp.]